MEYLTWRKLRDELNKVRDDKVLDEPALFAHMDNYGSETLMPMQLIQDTWHPDDTPRTVVYNDSQEEFSRTHDLEDDDIIPVRKLPHGALLLAYGGIDEDLEETCDWLKMPTN